LPRFTPVIANRLVPSKVIRSPATPDDGVTEFTIADPINGVKEILAGYSCGYSLE